MKFGRYKQPDLSNDDAVPHGDGPGPSEPGGGSARAAAERISELRWQWRSACTATSLSQMIYTPSGMTRAVPMIGQVDLGPSVSFTVRLRPGQTVADFTAAAPSIAPTLDVESLQILPFAPHWVRVVLLPPCRADAEPLVRAGRRSVEIRCLIPACWEAGS